LVIVGLVAALVLRSWVAAQTRAVIVLSRTSNTPLVGWLVGVVTDEPRAEDMMIAGQPATLVRPGAGRSWRAVVFVNGVTRLGRHHPDVERLARALARAGYLVAVPDPPGLRQGTLTLRTLAATTPHALERARDLLQRDFTATRPNEKWVADITYLRTWNGFVYLAFILDCYSRMIVGWQLATHLRTDLVLDALEMANGLRCPMEGLIAHTDRGSQYTSIRYTDRLDELGAAPSVGSRGDAYDNAMAEAWVATFKANSSTGVASRATSTPSTRRCTGSASTTLSGCTKNSVTCRPPSTRS